MGDSPRRAASAGEPQRFIRRVKAIDADLAKPATKAELAVVAHALQEQPATKGDVQRLRRDVQKQNQQLAAKIPDLNGTVDALKRLAHLEAPLTTLVNEVLPDWQQRASANADQEVFRRVLGRYLGWKYTRWFAITLTAVVLEATAKEIWIPILDGFLRHRHLLGY